MVKKTLVTFDIDGTICVQGKGEGGSSEKMMHTLAFNHAFLKVFGVDAHIGEVKHAGSTDQLILLHVLLERGFDKEEVSSKMGEMKEAMIEYAQANKERAGDGLTLLPGVKETLAELSTRDDVLVGLVTGNLEPIAWLKMEALGIKQYFSTPNFGGFGSDYTSGDPTKKAEDRAEMVRIAAKRAAASYEGVEIGDRYHIGDAPPDVWAAEAGGAAAVGVTTGNFGEADLRPFIKGEASVVLKDLSNREEVRRVLGLA